MKKLFFFTIMFTGLTVSLTNAQVYSNREVQPDDDEDNYPYLLPIWAEKAVDAGYNLPHSGGVGVNYLWQESDLIIGNLRIGFNNGEMIELDEIIRFNNAVSTTNSVNIRPDFWLFPFLNVYGIFARTEASTAVDFTIEIPNVDKGINEITSFSTVAAFDATTAGIGITPTIGISGGWIALDMNMAWTDIPALSEPAFSFVFGPRVGKTFKLKKEDRNITIWAGGFRVALNTGTNGSLPLSDLFDTSELEGKIDNAYVNLEDSQNDLDDWWNGLTPQEQALPSNQLSYNSKQRLISIGNEFVGRLDQATENISTSTVQYGLDKRQANMWNFIVGSQFQLNKNLMIRAEYGFLGTRTQFIGGLQYRFRL